MYNPGSTIKFREALECFGRCPQQKFHPSFESSPLRTDRSPMERLGLPILYISSNIVCERATVAAGLQPVVQVNLIQMRTHQFFTQLIRLSGNPFQPVLVMQSAEDRSANNLTIVGQLVPVAISRGCESLARVRNSRSQAGMWSPLIIVRNPLFQDSSHVPLVL